METRAHTEMELKSQLYKKKKKKKRETNKSKKNNLLENLKTYIKLL